MEITVKATWERTLEEDFQTLLTTEMARSINSAMLRVADKMVNSLKQHVDEDVYKPYRPQVYLRRSENPRFGIPMNDIYKNITQIFNPVEFAGNIFGGRIGFDYHPDGNNSATTADLKPGNFYYDADNPRPLKPTSKAVHGDALIRRIETGEGYDWTAPKYAMKKAAKYAKEHGTEETPFPPRPFWQRFVDEMTDGNAMETEIFWKMRENGFDIEMDEGVIREAEDGDY